MIGLDVLEVGRQVLDVLLVAIVIYNLMLLIRGTRAVQIIVGIVLVVGLYYIADVGRLATLKRTLENFFAVLPIAILVLFQDEIRRALAQVGRRPIWGSTAPHQLDAALSEIALAAGALSSQRTGALIVIERLDGLKNYIDNGIVLDCIVSHDLLINLFNPAAPLHDGAVIVQRDRIASAACFLPLTLDPELSKDHGTRHRAALGISETTDAVAVVVSEETGNISTAIGGKLRRRLDANDLRNSLYKTLITDLYAQLGTGR